MIRALRKVLAGRRRLRSMRALGRAGVGLDLDPSAKLVFPSTIEVGDYVHIGPACYLNGRGRLVVGDHVIMAPHVAIMTSMHRYRDAALLPYDEVELLRPVTIEQCVWIGMRAMILPGVTIGEGSIVGAGAVVSRSCPPGSILGGNPARIISTRDMAHYRQLVTDERFYLKRKLRGDLNKREQHE